MKAGRLRSWFNAARAFLLRPSEDDDFWYRDLPPWGSNTYAGPWVDEPAAMQSAVVASCVRLIAGTIASLPLNVYERLPNGGKAPANGLNGTMEHPLFAVLHRQPNPRMTSFEWKERAAQDLETYGNHYSLQRLDTKGNVAELWPIRSDRLTPEWQDKTTIDSPKLYRYRSEDGNQHVFFEDEILHIPGLGFDGLKGKSPIEMVMQHVGYDLSLQRFGAKFLSQGFAPRFVIQHPAKFLSDQARKNFKASLKAEAAGLHIHETMVLEEGMTVKEIGIPPEHAQFLETRKFSRSEIAGFFGVPPHFIGDVEKSTSWGTGIEQQQIGWVQTGILPRIRRMEERLNVSLFGPRESQKFFAEFNLSGMLRGDAKSRANFYRELSLLGAISPNEIRALENMNPVEGGDVYQRPLNTAFVDASGKLIQGLAAAPDAEAAALLAVRAIRYQPRQLPGLEEDGA